MDGDVCVVVFLCVCVVCGCVVWWVDFWCVGDGVWVCELVGDV